MTLKQLRALAKKQGIDTKGMSKEDLEFSVDLPTEPVAVNAIRPNCTKAVQIDGWGLVYLSEGSLISGERATAIHRHYPDLVDVVSG